MYCGHPVFSGSAHRIEPLVVGVALILNVWNTLCLLAPWLLLGAAIAGLLHVVLPVNWLKKKFSGRAGVFKAVAFGVPLPLCSCGVIPAGIGLRKQGASDQAAIAFLISTPQTGIDSVLVSASFLGWPFAIFKVVLAAITGVVGGLVATDTRSAEELQIRIEEQSSFTARRSVIDGLLHALELIHSIWLWLVIGILLSVLIEVWIVPTSWFQAISSSGPMLSMLIVLLISLPLYVCATASVPIAAALVAGGMPHGAALVFLVAGPATNIATMGAVYSRFGARNLFVYLATLIVGSIVGGLVFDGVIAAGSIKSVDIHHDHLDWFSVVSGTVLAGILAWSAGKDVKRLVSSRFAKQAIAENGESRTYVVSGMNCQNCVSKIETQLGKIPTVTAVVVDLEKGLVVVAGSVDADTVRLGIRSAGFEVQ